MLEVEVAALKVKIINRENNFSARQNCKVVWRLKTILFLHFPRFPIFNLIDVNQSEMERMKKEKKSGNENDDNVNDTST